MRVDLTIVDDEALLCVGIEVKTHDASVRKGQLSDYQIGLEFKYPEHKVRMVYLTPLNRSRAGDNASRLHSIVEFETFAAEHPEPVHLSWLDVADINWPTGGDIWQQHQKYVREIICKPPNRNLRGLDTFFGAETAVDFFTALSDCGTAVSDGAIDLDRVTDPAALADAFRILIESPSARKDRPRATRFDGGPRDVLLASGHGAIHAELFALSDQYPWVWVQGRQNYGLRVAHLDHGSGVSICTSDGPAKLRVGQRR